MKPLTRTLFRPHRVNPFNVGPLEPLEPLPQLSDYNSRFSDDFRETMLKRKLKKRAALLAAAVEPIVETNNEIPLSLVQMTGDEPKDAVTFLVAAYADKIKKMVAGATGMNIPLIPLPKPQRTAITAALREMSDRLIDCSVEKATLANDERGNRYWNAHCDLLGIDRVISTKENANAVAEFAALLGLAWPVKADGICKRGMQAGSVSSILGSIRKSHQLKHNVELKALDHRSGRVIKGLKKIAGPQKPLHRLNSACYKNIVSDLRSTNTQKSLAIADAIAWCFEGLFRVSEICDTNGHNRSEGTQRYLVDADVHSHRTTTGRPRSIQFTLRKTKQKTEIQTRKIWAAGCQPDAGDDIVAASTGNDFVVRMDKRKIENAAFLVKHPSRALDLPFININGQPLHRNDIQDALQRGLQRCFEINLCNDPKLYKVGTHTCRRGGATLYYENGISDKSIMWLGRWQSIAWLVYPEVTDKGAQLMSGLVW